MRVWVSLSLSLSLSLVSIIITIIRFEKGCWVLQLRPGGASPPSPRPPRGSLSPPFPGSWPVPGPVFGSGFRSVPGLGAGGRLGWFGWNGRRLFVPYCVYVFCCGVSCYL